ncbi:hypothetical protein C1E24_20365 [Pseudoalteromonas phenolica]|uniref:DUF2914 domain-containing protein n=1 Tax=Pseudoalteromonas phenolica TaxID=161398 RepID=A0A5R9PWY3_9GAMM|nr:DUF2914 domain-containing protein [Pseudoalteromonas phenolica]TLX45155.1 hypothetical protein C1E24_20365 [Pseudoalteromonas phenolica]
MSQKIVIKTSVSKAPAQPQAVHYQWHWRRIFMAASMLMLTAVAIVYGLMNSVNADEVQNIEMVEPNTVVISEPELVTDTAQQELDNEVVVISEPEEVIAEEVITPVQTAAAELELQESVQNAAAVDNQAGVEKASVALTEQTDTMQTLDSEPEFAQVTDEISVEKETVETATNSPEAEQDAETSSTQFSDNAKVTSVALGAQIDVQFISRAVLTTGISEREPVDVLKESIEQTEFQEKLFFFTEVRKLKGQTISHLWFHQDQLMAEIPLTISADRYRTYSSKNIMPSQTGQWRVEAVTEQGELLAQKTFRIIPSAL